jgi:outer membrane protein TolC
VVEAPAKVSSEAQHLSLVDGALEPTPSGITSAEVVKRALESSPLLMSATIQADKAALNQKRAKLAFAPRVDLNARYTHLSYVQQPSLGALAGGGMAGAGGAAGAMPGFKIPQVLDQYALTASGQLPVTEWFLTILPTYRGAKRMSEVAEQQRLAVALQVSFDARVAFYELLLLRGALVLAQDSIQRLEANVKDLTALTKAGVATPTDLMLAEAALANAQTEYTERKGYVEVATVRLQQVMGEELDISRGVGEPLVGFELNSTPAMPDVLAAARSNRPELEALRIIADARHEFARAKRGASWPQIRVFGDNYTANPPPRRFLQQEKFGNAWDVGVSVGWSPNDAVFAHTQASDYDVDIKLARQDLIVAEDGLTMEVTSAVTNHRTAREAVGASIKFAEAARRRFEDQRALMNAGAATPKDVLEAETELRQAELAWISAFIHVREAEAALLKAQGQTGVSGNSGSAP